MRREKRGVSPVIASVLMILLVMVLAVIVFLWAKGFIGEQVEKFGENIDNYCDRVSFQIAEYDGTWEVKNSGSVNISSFEVHKVKDGDTEVEGFPYTVDANDVVSSFVGSVYMDDGSTPDEVILYPVLIGTVSGENKNSIYTCLDAGVTL